jgi:hypothetical protein
VREKLSNSLVICQSNDEQNRADVAGILRAMLKHTIIEVEPQVCSRRVTFSVKAILCSLRVGGPTLRQQYSNCDIERITEQVACRKRDLDSSAMEIHL